MSDFIAVRSLVNRHDTEIISLRQAALTEPAPETAKLHLPLYSGERSTLPNLD